MGSTFIIVVSSIIVLVLASTFSFWIGRRNNDSENWIVGGRSLPFYVVAGTQFATGMGGGVLVAHIGIGYSAGWSAVTYNLLYSVGILILVLLADWFKRQKFSTMPDIFKKLYGENKALISIVTIMTIVVPFGWLCTQLVAFGNLFAEITGISFVVLVIAFAFISLLFVLPGGLTSVAWTDFVFGCMMLIMSIVSGVYAWKMAGGWGEITDKVPETLTSFPEGLGAVGGITILLWVLSIFPGALTNQMSYQRIYAAKSSRIAKKGFVIAAIVTVISGIWASFMGISILSMNPGLENEELASGWFLTQIPLWFLGIYSAFIIATIMSTVSSAIHSVVVNITKDIYQTYINPNVSDNKLLRLSRIMSVVVVSLAVVLAIVYPRALDWLVSTYAYSASGLLIPIFVGFFLRNSNKLNHKVAISSIVLGILSSAIAQIIGTNIPYAAFGIVGSLIGFLLFYFLFNKPGQIDHHKEEKLGI